MKPLWFLFLVFLTLRITWAEESVTLEALQPDCNAVCDRQAIVFVHGLWGSKETWKNSSTGSSWPEMLRTDPACKLCDVFVVSYPTSLGNSAGNSVRLT